MAPKRKSPPPMDSHETETDTLDLVIAEQRRQITEAQALHYDLDFAFNLQMQEAITASLSQHQSEVVSVETETEADNDDAYALLLQDMERIQQEREDYETSKKLMTEYKQQLDISIHDRKFADEILNMPDEKWDHDGDYYNKPYSSVKFGASTSKTTAYVESERFSVYCKGVVSEEYVRGMKVIVGGIGVGISDSRGNLIWEVSKGIDGVESIVVELEGVLEGLCSARSLELENVDVVVDHDLVYNYITGATESSEDRISTLLDRVFSLQKKFTDYQSSLVTQDELKFAFKLARAAILSQITWNEETSEGESSAKETCVICFEDKAVNQMFSVEHCLHRFCFACMKQHVEAKLLNGLEAKCPQVGCESKVSIETCGKLMDPRIFDMMVERKKESSMAITERVYCPILRCSALMSKTEVLEYTKTSFIGAESSGARKCVNCQHFFCINCRVPWHYNQTCDYYRRLNPNPRADDGLLNNLARQNRWRQCVRCKHMVELAEGCYHITCRCGYEFCYTCGAEWRGKRPTCNCQIWDERNIIRR